MISEVKEREFATEKDVEIFFPIYFFYNAPELVICRVSGALVIV